MKLVFLGTGGSHPTPARNVMAVALKYEGDVYLFDCGEGTQRQFMRSSISFMDTKKIFITHFHGDHFLGLPGLIQSMNLNDRKAPLDIYGPEGTREFTYTLIKMGYFNPGFPVHIHELKPGAGLRFDSFSISTLRANHNVPTLGYVFKENDRRGRFDKQKALDMGVPEGPLFSKIQNGETVEVDGKTVGPEDILGPPRRGRKIVYSGDTKPSRDIQRAAKNATALIHDATLESAMSDKALRFGHSSVENAASIAKRANVERLFLVHMSPRYDDADMIRREAESYFENSIVPDDLDEYEL